MWNEIWTFMKDYPGYILVGLVVIGFLIKIFWWDKRKKKKSFEGSVPKPSTKEYELSEQPDYKPYFKPQEEEDGIPAESRLSDIDNKIEKIKAQGKALAEEGRTLDTWHETLGKRYVEQVNKISLRKKKIDDTHSLWTNHKRDMARHLADMDKLNKKVKE